MSGPSIKISITSLILHVYWCRLANNIDADHWSVC